MGQKINPTLYRLSYNKNWSSEYYLPNYSQNITMDMVIRKYIDNLFKSKNINYSNITIKKYPNKSTLHIYFFCDNDNFDKLQLCSQLLLLIKQYKLNFKHLILQYKIINDIPYGNAQLLAKYIASQKQGLKLQLKKLLLNLRLLIRNQNRNTIKGYKIKISGRIGGSEMARTKIYSKGAMPLQTISKYVDYGIHSSYTKVGLLGIKVWLYY